MRPERLTFPGRVLVPISAQGKLGCDAERRFDSTVRGPRGFTHLIDAFKWKKNSL